ncbi:hypothetical protein LCGC14_1970120 [marine sediment metagenome]|uniref:Uncharacterized protein n=1 Tax=marine sediment metagenome TaxID=412755 RepID=A0A0F9I8Z9_9ZZZZ
MGTAADSKEKMEVKLDNALPRMPEFIKGIRRVPDRGFRRNPFMNTRETAWQGSLFR